MDQGIITTSGPAPQSLLISWRGSLVELDQSENTIRTYLHAVRQFLAWYEKKGIAFSPTNLTSVDFVAYRNNLQKQQKAASTINVTINALHAFGRWLVEMRYIQENPVRLKQVSSVTHSKRTGLTDLQVHALLRQAQLSRHPQRDYAIIQLLVQTGLRIEECSRLTFGDITFKERGGMILVRAGKGKKSREVPFNASAREAIALMIAPILGLQEATIKAVVAAWPQLGSERATTCIFQSQKGGILTSSAMQQMIAGLVKLANVPEETSAHTLRHTFAHSFLTQYPGDIASLALILGHSSLDTTMLYAEPTIAQVSVKVEQMDQNAYHS